MTEQDINKINGYIVQIARGNKSALEALADIVSARMLSVALSVVGNRAVAEDVVQDSFLCIYRKAYSFRGGNGYSWICKITQNTALNRLRSEKRNMGCDFELFSIAADDNVEERATAAIAVQQAMDGLSELEKRVVYQKYFMDFTVRDSAKGLEKSKSTVARAIASAEKKIRNFLDGGTKTR